jgi:hypothetical protein
MFRSSPRFIINDYCSCESKGSFESMWSLWEGLVVVVVLVVVVTYTKSMPQVLDSS